MSNQNITIAKLRKQKAYAWAKYYEELTVNHYLFQQQYNTIQPILGLDILPNHLVNEIENMMKELKKKLECPICFEIIDEGKLKITGCGHKFCENCFNQINKCAICRRNIRK